MNVGLDIAENDLQAGYVLWGDLLVRRETVLLMVQQSLEKSLKSVLCAIGKPIPVTYERYLLVERLSPAHVPPYAFELDDLTPYASIRRYEEGKFKVTEEDIRLAFEMAKQVIEWCEQKVAQSMAQNV